MSNQTPTIPPPVGTGTVTRKQGLFLAAIIQAAGAATQRDLCAVAEVNQSTVWRWRQDADFQQAERSAYRAALYDRVPQALKALDRLLEADVNHGPKGLAAAQRAVELVLEGSGISSEVPPRAMAVAAPLRVTVDQPAASRPTVDLVEDLDGQWVEGR